ncbi:MAG: type II secretion system F family protein [Planctomycetota bacterium]|nr:MAG: type II secretion system F family protein [Planctomycetota bacterium]
MSSTSLIVLMPIMGCMLLAVGIFQVVMELRTGKKQKVIDRLNETKAAKKKEQKIKESLLRQRMGDQPKNFLEAIVSKLKVVDRLQRILDQADIDWSASRTLVNLSGLSLLAGCGMALMSKGLIACVAVGLCVMFLPLLVLVYMRKRRIRKLVEQLPDVFDLMSQALRAGHALASAIQLVSQQLPNPVGGEFARVFHEQNLGIKVEDALLNMGDRVDQMDVRFFVTAVLIQRQTGGDLAEILDKIGKVIRDRVQLLGTVQAFTAEGRLSGWVLLALPVLVFFASLSVNPDYARVLLDTPSGRMMLGVAIGMDLMGMAMIKKIVNIKV